MQNEIYYDLRNFGWSNLVLFNWKLTSTFQYIDEGKLQWVPYRLLHRRKQTNKKLYGKNYIFTASFLDIDMENVCE